MRPKLLAAISVLVAIAVAGGIYLRSSSSPDASRPARSYAFEMCVTRGARSAEQHWTDPVLAAVARTITNGERTALEEALAISATRWEARANPFLEDIDDSSPDAPLEAWLEGAPAFVRTAQAAARIHACAPDGFCARPRTGGACPDGWTRAENEGETGRARFLVWPWGHALRMRAPSETDARRAAILLRSRIHGSGRIALVLAADDVEVTKREPFAKLRELWGR